MKRIHLCFLLCMLALFAAIPICAQVSEGETPAGTVQLDPNGGVQEFTDEQEHYVIGVVNAPWYSPITLAPTRVLLTSGALLLVLLGYLLYAGFVVGKGRPRRTGDLRPTPPEGLSPAIMRMIRLMGSDPKTLAAAFVSLAAKGTVTLGEQGQDFEIAKAAGAAASGVQGTLLELLHDSAPHSLADLADALNTAPKNVLMAVERLTADGYVIRNDGAVLTLDSVRPRNAQATGLLGTDEQAVLDTVFCDHDSLLITGANKGYLIPAMSELSAIESTEFQQRYYNPNAGFRKAGVGLGVAAVLLAGAIEYFFAWLDPFAALFMMAGFLFLIGKVIPQWALIIRGRAHRPAVMAGWMVVGTLITGGFFIFGLRSQGRIPLLLLLITIAAMYGNMWLGRRLKVPTPEGRRVMDDIDGFRQFLLLSPDQARVSAQGPARSPKLFADYLPFAVALDAEEAWARQCAGLFPGPVRFEWYRGEFADLPSAAVKLGAALPYAIDLALNDQNARGTDVAEEDEEEEPEKPAVTK